MDDTHLERLIRRVRRWLFESFVLFLIAVLFVGLTLWHARLGGFESTAGTIIGIITLFLLFSPVIDWLLAVGLRVTTTRVFGVASGILGLGRLVVTLAAAGGIIAAFALNPSGQGIPQVLKTLLKVLTS